METATDSNSRSQQNRATTENVVEPSWWDGFKEDAKDLVLGALRGLVIIASIVFILLFLVISWVMVYGRLQTGLFPTNTSAELSFGAVWGIIQTCCFVWLMNRVFIKEYTVEDYHKVRQDFFLKHRGEGKGFLHRSMLWLNISIHKLELLISYPARLWKEENEFDHIVILIIERVLQFLILTPILLMIMCKIADLCPIIIDWWGQDQPIWAEKINLFNEQNPEYLIFAKMTPPYIALLLTAYLFLKIPIFYLVRKMRKKKTPSQ